MAKRASLLIFLVHRALAISAIPDPLVLSQPDGHSFEAFLRGDEWRNWYESTEGFSIIRNDRGEWMFAMDVQDGKLLPSQVRVAAGVADPTEFGLAVARHLQPEHMRPEDRSPVPGLALQLREDFRIPLLLVEFPDYASQYPVENFTGMMNTEGWNGTGSFRDYYEEVSYDQFHPYATVDGWFEANNDHDYYGYETGYGRVLELVRQVVDDAEAAGFDFSVFDNDGDGWVDALNVVHAGPGAEEGDLSNIWSHKWSLSVAGLQVRYDGVWIDSYTINPEIQYDQQVFIGVLTHEFGHALGLPDLYDTDGSSAGAGNWALMAGGSWGTNGASPWYPSHMCAWSKAELDWVSPTIVVNDTTGVQIPAVETNPVVYQVDHPLDDSEYFLLENRQKVGFDVNMYRSGLLIWHIDTEKTQGWGVNNDEPHYGVGLEQADGDFDLENGYNRGDPGDPYPGSSGNHTFDDDSTPNSASYYFVPSLISVDSITLDGDSVRMNVGVGSDVMVEAELGVGQGAAWDTGSVAVALANDFEISEFSCLIHDHPDRLIVVGVRSTERAQSMSASFAETSDGNASIVLTGGIIAAGTGAIFEIDYFSYTGAAMSIALETMDADAVDANGEEVVVSMGDGLFDVFSGPQVLSVITSSASPGSLATIPVNLNSTVPISFVGFRLEDSPDALSLFEEPFTDDNLNGQWDTGEPFEDTNGDGVWTGSVLIGAVLDSNWNVQAGEANGTIIFSAGNWPSPLDPDSALLVTFNIQVSPSAAEGAVLLDFSNIMMIDFLGNPSVEGVGVSGSFVVTGAVAIDDEPTAPDQFVLYQNYPNPFNPVTTIRFDLPADGNVKLVIYDVLGREVARLAEGLYPSGFHRVVWDASNLASGIYICRLVVGQDGSDNLWRYRRSRKLVVLE